MVRPGLADLSLGGGALGVIDGQFLRALFGYSATPEATTFVAWLAYIVVVLALFLRPSRPSPAPVGATSAAPAAPAQG